MTSEEKEILETKSAIAADTKKKKKKKKKKNKNNNRKVVNELPSPTFPTLEESEVEVSITSNGRHAVAKHAISRGSVLLAERPTCNPLIRARYAQEICANCLNPCDTTYKCSTCGLVVYCSSQCQAQFAHIHDLECKLTTRLPSICTQGDVDLDLIRLASRVCLCRELSDYSKEEYTRIENLLTHQNQFTSAWSSTVFDVCETVSDLLKSKGFLPMKSRTFVENTTSDMLFGLCCRINVNSYGYRDDSNADIAIAVLANMGAVVNHSCCPSAVFNAHGPTMQIRALRNLEQGEEISISYIDLFQSRSARVSELQATKFFTCKCKRCTSSLRSSVDRKLNSFLCSDPDCTGIYIPVSGIETSNSGLKPLEDEKKQNELDNHTLFECDECGGNVDGGIIQKNQTRLHLLLQDAERCYSERQLLPAIKAFETLLTTFTTESKKTNVLKKRTRHKPIDLSKHNIANNVDLIACPLHESILQAHCKLVNLKDAQDKLEDSVKYLKVIVASLEQVLPSFHAEIGVYLYHLGDRLSQLAVKQGLNRRKQGEYKQQAITVFTKCKEIRVTNRGQEHSSVSEAVQRLAQLQAPH